jgi:predicted metal-dependent enzyme (double-stranded beta helix superfamily)
MRTILQKQKVCENVVHHIQDVVIGHLPSMQRAVGDREFEAGRYLLYKDSDFGFVIMMLVWKPQQSTPIHGHGIWGIEAVLKNYVRVTNYTNCNKEPKEIGSVILPPGAVAYVLPPDADVHRVSHYGKEPAITIHIYGKELTQNLVFKPGTGFHAVDVTARELEFDFDWTSKPFGDVDFQI